MPIIFVLPSPYVSLISVKQYYLLKSVNCKPVIYKQPPNLGWAAYENKSIFSLSAYFFFFFADSLVESESLSSGVGTSSHSGSAGSSTTPTESHPPSLILAGMHVVCLENFSNPDQPNGLHMTQGDIIEGKDTVWIVGLLLSKKILDKEWQAY